MGFFRFTFDSKNRVLLPFALLPGAGNYVTGRATPDFLFITTLNRVLRISKDWTAINLGTVLTGNGQCSAFSNNRLFIGQASNYIRYTDDGGQNWLTLNAANGLGANGNVQGIAGNGGGGVVALTAANSLYYSADNGSTFTAVQALTSGGGSFERVEFLGNRWLARSNVVGEFATSTDGVTWSLVTVPGMNTIVGCFGFFNGQIYIFGQSTTATVAQAFRVDENLTTYEQVPMWWINPANSGVNSAVEWDGTLYAMGYCEGINNRAAVMRLDDDQGFVPVTSYPVEGANSGFFADVFNDQLVTCRANTLVTTYVDGQ